jgi:cellulose biosynthesis protein BcsQ
MKARARGRPLPSGGRAIIGVVLQTRETLAIANLKGGLARQRSRLISAPISQGLAKRVLLIDLDFQGWLLSMAFPGKDWLPGAHQSSLATRLISSDLAPVDIVMRVQKGAPKTRENSEDRLQLITAYLDLAQADNTSWSNGCFDASISGRAICAKGNLLRTADVRYTLAKILHSDIVQRAFDLIIIDCPRRLTTLKIQALCAGSHLLVPTIFDRTSAQAVVRL